MINFFKNHWWKILIILLVLVVVIIPLIYFLIAGYFPPRFPIQRLSKSPSVSPSIKSDINQQPTTADIQKTSDLPKIDIMTLSRIKGFTPYYYQSNQPPKIDILKSWGANLININIEDEAGFKEQNALLQTHNLPELPLPDLAPADPALENVIENLIKEAKQQGLAVSLAIPVSEKWLKLAKDWQVEMIWLNAEADAWVINGLTAQKINQINQTFLQKSRQFYTGYIGTGFTNLIDRSTFKPTSNASQYDLTGFDFLTINPHPDPSMKADRLIDYVKVTTKTARSIADRSKIKKLLLGAIIVKTATDELQGFMPEESPKYSADAEALIYQKLIDTTKETLDGYFFDFSGFEKRQVTKTISQFYLEN